MSQKKTRVDSVAEAVRIASAVNEEITFPENVPLEEGDVPFFKNVIAEYARAEWSAHQLEIAAMLARTMADLVREQDLLRSEGAVAYSEKGTPLANPRKSIVQMHASSILSFRRSLALHARAIQGEARDSAKRRDTAKEIEAGASTDDDLLA
ncbi:terminase small subunit [Agrobacterium fabacearum]|uniref:terminase small subunit n=1 Tax=Agrobacterium tumefaciens TaxID=358 RepID=UPI002853545A|nr:terminase small subunit [Agrobacterium tumefaciens]MDR5008290.1 terminase small subunit [Agrobacterium tumefaciens]